jgi:hypothetical protein
MRGSSPRVLVAYESSEEQGAQPSGQDWQDSMMAHWKHVFGVPDMTFTAATSISALDAVAELLGHMYNEIWLA